MQIKTRHSEIVIDIKTKKPFFEFSKEEHAIYSELVSEICEYLDGIFTRENYGLFLQDQNKDLRDDQ